MHVGVIGAGAWGTALAQVAAQNGPVTLWAFEPEVADAINVLHENSAFLAGVPLSPAIRATAHIAELEACEALLVVTPAQHMRAILRAAPVGDTPLLLCAKGIEAGTMALMSEVAAQACPGAPIAALSGPTFAGEVASGLPTAVTLACPDEALGARLSDRIALPHFRPYRSTDLTGAEIGGAVKNVLAIACGAAAGMDLGASAGAALIARGFAELGRFGRASGARPETLMGLSGLGDLVLTCASVQSRNFAFGHALGAGASLAEAGAGRLAEGVATAPVLCRLARARGVDMPVSESVAALVGGLTTPRAALDALMARPARAES